MKPLGISIRHPRYGVLCNGEDETSRIDAAIRDIRRRGRAVLWAAGIYTISGTIAMANDAEYWRGEGAWLTEIRMLNPDLPAFAIPAKNNCKIEGMAIVGQGAETDAAGIQTDGAGGWNADSARILDVEIKNFGTGLLADGLANSQIRADLTANGIGYRQTGNSNANELGGSITSNVIGVQIESGTGLDLRPMDFAGSETEIFLNLLGGYDITVNGANCEVSRDHCTFAKVAGARNVILNGCSVAGVGGDWTGITPVDAAVNSDVTLNQCRFQGEALQRNRVDTKLVRYQGDRLKVKVLENDGSTFGYYWANEYITRMAGLGTLSAADYAGQTIRCVTPGDPEQHWYSRDQGDGTYAWEARLP